MTTPVRARRFASRAAVAAVLVMTGCATTLDDDPNNAQVTGDDGRELADEDVRPLDSGVIVDDGTPPTTVAIVGSATELLPEIGVDMSRLSAEIADDGDEDATLARIESNWAAIRDEIERDRPELLNSIQATVDMAGVAVERNRPADADKAFSLLTDLVDSFTGDG